MYATMLAKSKSSFSRKRPKGCAIRGVCEWMAVGKRLRTDCPEPSSQSCLDVLVMRGLKVRVES